MEAGDVLSLVRPHLSYLFDNLDLGWRLVNALCDVGLLTWDDRVDVMNEKERRNVRINRLVTEILPYRGPNATERFLEALKLAQQHHIVKRLREPIYAQEARQFG